MASTGSPIVDKLVDETAGKVKDTWDTVTGAKAAAAKKSTGADPDMLKEANDSFKPQAVGKKAVAKSPVAKPTTVAAKAAPRKKI